MPFGNLLEINFFSGPAMNYAQRTRTPVQAEQPPEQNKMFSHRQPPFTEHRRRTQQQLTTHLRTKRPTPRQNVHRLRTERRTKRDVPNKTDFSILCQISENQPAGRTTCRKMSFL